MTERVYSDFQTESQLASRDTWQQYVACRRGIGDTALSNILPPLGAMEMMMELPDVNSACEAVGHMLSDQNNDEAAEVMDYLGRVEDKKLVFGGLYSLAKGKIPGVDITPELQRKISRLVEGGDMTASHQRLVEQWPTIGMIFEEEVSRGIDEGYIPEDVRGRLHDAVTRTSVRVADSAYLDIVLEATGYYLYDRDEIALHSKSQDIRPSIHELTHKISGGTFVPNRDSGGYERSRNGFSAVDPDEHTRSELNEALTQHVTCGILYGDFATIDPDERRDEDCVYYESRKVVAAFIDRSNGVLDTEMFMHAYFEDSGPQGSTAARRRLVRQANAAYGSGALTKLDTLLKVCTMIEEDKFYDVFYDIILENISMPVCDDNGTIMVQGTIDHERIFALTQEHSDRFRTVMEGVMAEEG